MSTKSSTLVLVLPVYHVDERRIRSDALFLLQLVTTARRLGGMKKNPKPLTIDELD